MLQSEFGKIERRDAIYFIAIAIGSGVLFSFNMFHPFLRILLITFLLFQAVKDPFRCWGTFIVTQRYIDRLFSSYVSVAILGILFLSFFIKKPHMLRKLKDGLILLIGVPLIAISIIVGQRSNTTTGIYMGIILLTILAMLNFSDSVSRTDTTKIAFAYCCGAVSVAIYFMISMATHVSILKYGRLNFFGDIKPIAFATFIPLLFIVSSKLEGKKCFDNVNSKLLDAVLIVIYVAIIILTAARGMIFAGIVALGMQALLSKNQVKAVWRLLPVVLFVAVFIYMTMASSNLRIARIFTFQDTELGSLNGRTMVWGEYFELYRGGNILRKIFGFGPGDGGRLISSGLYTHSTFLDYLISYGAVGFITMLAYELKAIKRVFNSKDLILFVVLIFSIVAEATHGNSANYALLSLQTFLILCVAANNSSDKAVVEEKSK